MYSALTGQFRRYMGHVTKKILEVFMIHLKPMTWQEINLKLFLKLSKKEAFKYTAFQHPKWLMDQKIYKN
jgi:hypothetical protein